MALSDWHSMARAMNVPKGDLMRFADRGATAGWDRYQQDLPATGGGGLTFSADPYRVASERPRPTGQFAQPLRRDAGLDRVEQAMEGLGLEEDDIAEGDPTAALKQRQKFEDRRAMPAPTPDEEDEGLLANTALGRFQKNTLDPARANVRKKLGLTDKTAEGLGGALQHIGGMLMGF